MLGILIIFGIGLIGFVIATLWVIKTNNILTSCLIYIIATFSLFIGFGVTCHNVSYDIKVPIDQPLSLVTPSQVLSKGTHLNGDLKHAYLVTNNASKAIDKVETKGTGSTVTEITYSIRHTDNKWFGLTVDKDVEKRQAIATVHLDDATDKTLKHFFN